MKRKLIVLCVLFATALSLSATDDAAAVQAEQEAYIKWAKELWESLDRQTGEIIINEANATLDVPVTFYYLNAEDARKVLEDVWNNPPNEEVLGMLFPAEYTPFDAESWAVTIEYEEDGYVSDDDADDIDYGDLMEEMQASTREESKGREELGYGSIELLGWAADPYYDRTTHKMYWAKELKFAGQEVNTLNYNIRVLGRRGVMVLNFIAGMDQKELVESKLDKVLAMADFDEGATYADFDPSMDKVAAYGLGALVAGKLIAKTGFFAVLIKLLSKFGIFIVVGAAALWNRLRNKKKTEA